MACFSPMLRRVSSSEVPLAIRSSRSLGTFHGIAAASSTGGNQRDGGSRRVLQFSTEAKAAKVGRPRGREENVNPAINRIVSEKNVKRAINRLVSGTDHKPMKLEIATPAPEELNPLKVVDDPDKSYVVFKWENDDEIIKVKANHYGVKYDDGDDDKYGMGLSITVTKRGCEVQLGFGATAYPDKLSINRLSLNKKVVKDGPSSEQDKVEKDDSASERVEEEEDGSGSNEKEQEDEKYVVPLYEDSSYYGPSNWRTSDVVHEGFQKDLLYYLEVRGINLSTTKFFYDHMNNRRRRSIDKGDIDWLKNLKRFFDH